MIMELSIMQSTAALARAVDLKTRPVCVYGSDRIPENGIRSCLLSQCVASAMYQIAQCKVNDPVFVSDEPDQFFCRCIGGPAWFGYRRFDPQLAGLMSDGSEDKVSTAKHLKKNEKIAWETYRSEGDIEPIGKYVVMRRYDDMPEDQAVKCIICFGTSEQIRDLCALGHFGSRDAFGAISIPWGPACATLVTYPAGMAENEAPPRIYVGPTDPSSREWLPGNCMAVGIPSEIAREMAGDVAKSFLAR